jgi:hypothetical protein
MAGMLPDWMQGMQPAAPHGDPFMDYMRAQQPVDPYAMPTGSYADTPAPGMMGAPGESIQPGPPLVPMAPRPGVAPELDGPPPPPGQPAPPSWMPPGTSGQRELGATPEWLRNGQGKGVPANDAAPAAKPSGMPWDTPPTGTYQQRNRAITTAMQESKGREGQLEAQGQEAEAIARENAAKSRALADAEDLKSYEAATAKAGRDRAQLDVEIKQLSEGKIDPQRFWNDAGTGAKIGMAVSAIIGGILAPNYGGRNTGVEMIEGIIKRDMAAQESDRSNKQWALGQRRSSIGEGLNDAGDLASRQAQARAAAYGVAIDQATAMRSRMTAPVAIERANQAIMGLEAGYVDAVSQYEAGQQAAELAAMKARGGGRMPKPTRPEDPDKLATGSVMVPVKDADGNPVMESVRRSDIQPARNSRNPGQPVLDEQGRRVFTDARGKVYTEGVDVQVMPVRDEAGNVVREEVVTQRPKRTQMRVADPTDAREMRKSIAGYKVLDSALGDLEALGNLNGRTLDSKARTMAEQKAAQARMAIKQAWQMGALSDDEYKRLVDIVPNPTNVMQWSGMESVTAARRAFRDTAVITLQQYAPDVDEESLYGSPASEPPADVTLPTTAPLNERERKAIGNRIGMGE